MCSPGVVQKTSVSVPQKLILSPEAKRGPSFTARPVIARERLPRHSLTFSGSHLAAPIVGLAYGLTHMPAPEDLDDNILK